MDVDFIANVNADVNVDFHRDSDALQMDADIRYIFIINHTNETDLETAARTTRSWCLVRLFTKAMSRNTRCEGSLLHQ